MLLLREGLTQEQTVRRLFRVLERKSQRSFAGETTHVWRVPDVSTCSLSHTRLHASVAAARPHCPADIRESVNPRLIESTEAGVSAPSSR